MFPGRKARLGRLGSAGYSESSSDFGDCGGLLLVRGYEPRWKVVANLLNYSSGTVLLYNIRISTLLTGFDKPSSPLLYFGYRTPRLAMGRLDFGCVDWKRLVESHYGATIRKCIFGFDVVLFI
jgi:hypothetical protein